MDDIPVVKNIRDIFFDPNEDISNMDESQIAKTISSSLDGVKVNTVFEDDHVACFDVTYLVRDKSVDYLYKDKSVRYIHYWAGDLYRLFYQSEISSDIRETELANFLAREICESD